MKCVNCYQKLVYNGMLLLGDSGVICPKGKGINGHLAGHEPEPTEATEPHVCNEKCSKVVVEAPVYKPYVTELVKDQGPRVDTKVFPPQECCANGNWTQPHLCLKPESSKPWPLKAEREAIVGGQPPTGLIPKAQETLSKLAADHENIRNSQPDTPRPEMGEDALRDFVEQAQSICESATGPSVSDISKLRRLGKIAFPQGFKTLAAASGTESAQEAHPDQTWEYKASFKVAKMLGRDSSHYSVLKIMNVFAEYKFKAASEAALKPQPSSLTQAGPEKLQAFFHEIKELTLNHEVGEEDFAYVTADKLGNALEKVDPKWWAAQSQKCGGE